MLVVSILLAVFLGFVSFLLFQRKQAKGWWKGRAVLLTGAASGIGKEMALQLAGKGALLYLLDIIDLAEVVETCPSDNVYSFTCDISSEEEIQCLVEQLPNIDVVVLCAAAVSPPQRHEMVNDPLQHCRRHMEVNFFGNVFLLHYVQPLLSTNARVVLVSSMAAKIPVLLTAAYAASKSAIQRFCECLRAEQWHNIIFQIAPLPFVGTKNAMVNTKGALGHGASPFYVAQAILRGVSLGKREIFVDINTRLAPWMQLLMPVVFERILRRIMRELI